MGDHLIPLDVLLAFATLGLAGGAFGSIELVPTFPVQVVDTLGLQQLVDSGQLRLRRVEFLALSGIGQQIGYGLVGIALGITNQADRSAANPTVV